MILTGNEIKSEVKRGRIVIDPFTESSLNPNSYNYHIGSVIKVAPTEEILDPTQSSTWSVLPIPSEGFVLQPSKLYLANTEEVIGSHHYVTSLIGRSSIGRLGLYLQISADLGHVGAIHQWTLELTVVQPIRVYSGMVIGQVSFWVTLGDIDLYKGIYGTSSEPLENQSIVEAVKYDPDR